MIQLTRTRSQAVIDSVFTGEKRVALNKKLITDQRNILQGNAQQHLWDSDIWGRSKVQLLKESSNKCAYCEAPLKVVAYGDVEHYRPKSVYWWLAYSYENYLAACTLCNQAFKRDHFPLMADTNKWKGPAVTKAITDAKINLLAAKINCDPLVPATGMSFNNFHKAHKKEVALLINPYYEDPEKIFGYKADAVLQEVEIFVLPTIPGSAEIQRASIENYGLNRLELKQLRYEWYDNYNTMKMVLAEPSVSAILKKRIEDKIIHFKTAISPFTGMIRYFDKL